MSSLTQLILTIISSLLITIFIIGCGVEGTTSTDSESTNKISLHGVVLLNDGTPAKNISVINETIGESATTDSSGAYTFEPVPFISKYEFMLEGKSFTARTAVSLESHITSDSLIVNFKISDDLKSATSTIVKPEAPTPTPATNSDEDFDEDGNTDSFGIPKGLTGNAHIGKKFYFSTCTTCHQTINGKHYSYQRLSEQLKIPPMDTLNIKPQQIADLVAYLNFIR